MSRTFKAFLISHLFVISQIPLITSALGSTPLSWKQCVSLTASRNPELRSARAAAEGASLAVWSAQSGFLPTLSASLTGFRNNTGSSSSSSSTSASSSSSRTDNYYNMSLSLSQSLFAGLQTKGARDQAIANEKASLATLKLTATNISVALRSAYSQMIYAQNYLRLTSEIIRRREDNLRMVELRFENGDENKGSVLLSKAYLKEAQWNRTQAKNAIRIAARQLLQVMGSDENSVEVEIVDDMPLTPPETTPSFESLAIQSAEHEQAVAQAESAEAAVTIARAPLFPTLSLSGSRGESGTTFLPNNKYWSVGLSITMNLFNGGKDYSTWRQSAASLRSSLLTRENIDKGLLVKLEQTYSAFVEAEEKHSVDLSYLEAATVRGQIGRSKYNNGLLTFENWDSIENDLIVRQKAALMSQQNRATALAAWEQAQGKGVIPL